MAFTLAQLRKKHPELVRWETKLQDYLLMYLGGDEFLRSAGTVSTSRGSDTAQAGALVSVPSAFNNRPARRFLWQLEGEPNPVYFSRWNRTQYLNYLSAIIDYFCQWLFTQPPNIRATESKDMPEWFVDFFENADGSGTNLLDFVRDQFLSLCLYRRTGWLIGRDIGVAKVDEIQGEQDPQVVLTPYNQLEMYDWQKDSVGKLEWIVLHKRTSRREFPADRRDVETFTYVDRERWESYEVIKGQAPEEDKLELIGEGTHDIGSVPFVMMELPSGLWIADKLASVQLSLFNKNSMLDNAQLLGCIMQPFIQTGEARETAQSRIFGENVLLHLRTKDAVGGESEDFGWKSPDTKPLEFIASAIKELKDEMYRLCHQMALAVDAKSIGAIARSGASKIEDRKAAEIILTGYGGYVSEAILETLTQLGRIYGDNTEFTVDGFDNFQVSSLDEEIQIAALASTLGIKSPTFEKRMQVKMANRLLDKEDEETKEAIAEEIESAIDLAEEAKLAPPAIPHVVGEDGQPTPFVGAPIGPPGAGPGKVGVGEDAVKGTKKLSLKPLGFAAKEKKA